MLFTREGNADQFDHFSYGNLGVEANNQHSSCTKINLRGISSNSRVITGLGKDNIYGKSEGSSFGNSSKDGSSVSPGNFSFSWLFRDEFQSPTLGHYKRPLSDARPCQTACKRRAFEISASALTDDFVATREPYNVRANNGTRICNGSSGIPCLDHAQSTVLENLHLPDWMTSFPGYFEDCGLVAEHNKVDHIDSPVHKYLPQKDVPIGPDHQADIPEWRPRVSEIVPGASGSFEDMACSSVSTSEFVPKDDDIESDKWVRHCIVPMSASPFDGGENKVYCECRDEGSGRCVRQHILEARESLKMSLGQDEFRELGLCEMGEDVARRWTDEEEKQFQREVLANPVSLGKNFWDYLPHAFPGKSNKELVSYYFNVFMLRKRAQQNRSEQLRVDSDDDELPDEPLVTEHGKEDSAMEPPSHEHFINKSMSIEDPYEKSEAEHINEFSLHANGIVSVGDCGYPSNQMPRHLCAENVAEDVCNKDVSYTPFESQHDAPISVPCAEFQHGTAE